MQEAQYRQFEAVFEPLARARLSELVQALGSEAPDGFGPVERLDLDFERGVCVTELQAGSQPMDPLYLELVLTDGDEHGFEGVGLVLTCSIFASGQVWAPGNYTEQVGTLDEKELARRLQAMPVAEVAEKIHHEWSRLRLEHQLKAQGYDLDELERDNPYNAWMREQ